MLINLIETGRHRAWHASSTVWSAGAHSAVVVWVVAGSLAVHARTPPRPEQREVVYLLPTLPSSPRRATDGALEFRAGDAGVPVVADDGTIPVRRGRSARRAADVPPLPVIPIVLDSVERAGAPVFIAAELDRVVERDPTSAAPTYPPDLEAQRIEGGVSAEWVVDTTGHADTTTFRIVSATHPGFVAAVRAALPLMRFRPAELLGRRVQQMVRQEFTFRLHLPETPDSTPRIPPR